MSEETQKPALVADDVVVTLDYALKVDGKPYDSSEEDGPLYFLQGRGEVIPGLEKAIAGMKLGESKTVVVSAIEGYGEYDAESVMDVPRSEFPNDIPLKPGVELQLVDEDGDEMFARIVSIGKNAVKLDFNHPLAGKELVFDVTISDLRAPTEEELDHGHAHDDNEEEEGFFLLDDDDFDDEDFDDEDFDDDFDDDFDEDFDDDFEDEK